MHDLITLPDGKTVAPPPAQHPGFAALIPRLDRLPAWLPRDVNAEQFMVACMAEANGKGLEKCSPASIAACVFNCARVGLVPGAVLGHAHFVPFKNAATLVIGYKGFLELAYSCGFLKSVHAEVVLRGEDFQRWNDETGEHYRHPLPFNRDEQWANIEAAYCRWESQAGGRGSELVERAELAKLHKRGNVWTSDPVAMCKKTAIRRAAKTWKLTGRLAIAVTLDDLADVGKPQPMPAGVEAAEPLPALEEYDKDTADPTVYDKPNF
ncbi:MAG: recombinase RecT [Pseudomonadota bacterium]